MKVLIINPPTLHMSGSSKPALYVPVGILYIAAVLQKSGHDVSVYDTKLGCNIVREGKLLHFGDSYETIKKNIREAKPDVVCISNPFTVYMEAALRVAEIAKEAGRNIKTIIGGPHASVAPKDFLKNKRIDFAVMGEGEYTVPGILKCLEGKMPLSEIKNIAYRKGGKIIVAKRADFIADLDALPLPAYHLVDMEKYFTGKFSPRSEYTGRAISMITSRGCPFGCVFCSIHLHMGSKWRANSAEYVISHIKHVVRDYGVRLIHFEDDNFTLDRKRFEKILDGIIEGGINVKWDTPNGVRADTLDESLLLKAKKSGCQYLIVGVESGSQRVLDKIVGKRLDLKKVVEIAKTCKKIGLDLEAFYVVGFPGETLAEIEETFKFAKMLNEKYGVFPMFNIASPLINTRLYEICKKNNYFAAGVSAKTLLTAYRGGGGLIKTPEFSPQDIDAMFKKYDFFIKKARLKKALRHPYLLKSYVLKELLKTPIGRILGRK